MSRRKQNWERDKQSPAIHNPPESFYVRYENIIIYADGLLEPPRVITHQVQRAETWEKVKNGSTKMKSLTSPKVSRK